MRKLGVGLLSGSLVLAFSTEVFATICDYSLGNLLGSKSAGASAATASGSIAAGGAAMKAAGFYTLQHSMSGATMLASTAGGASGAGTVGIMGGTAGFIGTASSILMAPEVIGVGVALGVLELGCSVLPERVGQVTDAGQVLAGVLAISAQLHTSNFAVVMLQSDPEQAYLVIGSSTGSPYSVAVSQLYFEDGILKVQGLLVDTVLFDATQMLAKVVPE